MRYERFFADGAAYDPSTDSWRELPRAPIGARAPLAVWTGDELLVWGTAVRVDPRPRDGAAYDPARERVADDRRGSDRAHRCDRGLDGSRADRVRCRAARRQPPRDADRDRGGATTPRRTAGDELPDSSLSPQASTAAWVGQELVAWDYASGTATYRPQSDEWRALPDVPLDSGECIPESITVGEGVLGEYCGLLAWYDPAKRRWSDIAGTRYAGWSFELVAADPVALLLGRDAETGRKRMLAYRPG